MLNVPMYRFTLLLIEEDDQEAVRRAVLRGMNDNNVPTAKAGDAATELAGNPSHSP